MTKTNTAPVIEFKGDEEDPAALVTKALEDLQKSVDDRIKAVETKTAANDNSKIVARLEAVETKLARPTQTPANDNEPTVERKAFATYLRRGDNTPAEELKTLTVSNDPGGGYLAPSEMSTEFTRDLVQFSPVRAVASVRTTGSPSVTYPMRTGVTNAAWKGETQAATASEPAFGQAEIPVRELKTYVDISNELLADSAGQAEAEVRLALAEDFGAKEGTAFINGDGVLAPEGILQNAGIGEVVSGGATSVTSDALINLMYALPAAYRNMGTWAMSGTTLAALRKLKDSNGNYIWQPGLQAGQPETILGRPVVEMVDLPDIAAGSYPIVFGDWSGYRVVDRLALSVLVNPYLLATNGLTRIHATRRVGGAVLQPAKFKKMKVAVS